MSKVVSVEASGSGSNELRYKADERQSLDICVSWVQGLRYGHISEILQATKVH